MSRIIYFTFEGKECAFDIENKKLSLFGRNLYFTPKYLNHPSRIYLIFSKNCNLSCVYCFQKNKSSSINKLNIENIYKIINNYSNRYDEIIFFGGEPFLKDNFPIIENILKILPQRKYIVFTNGNYSEMYRKLLSNYRHLFKSIVITVDGPKEIHNSKRINPVSDSYENACFNLRYAHKLGINTVMQINVDRTNISKLDSLFLYLCENRSKYNNIILNPIKYIKEQLSSKELIFHYINYRNKYPKLNLELNNRTVNNLFLMFSGNGIYYNRCGLNRTIVCDFSSGIVYACPQNESSILGSIKDDKLIISQEKIKKEIMYTEYRGVCESCKLSYLCSKGCPYDNIKATKCEDELIENLTLIFDNFEKLFEVSD